MTADPKPPRDMLACFGTKGELLDACRDDSGARSLDRQWHRYTLHSAIRSLPEGERLTDEESAKVRWATELWEHLGISKEREGRDG